jgi:hypothetical protein
LSGWPCHLYLGHKSIPPPHDLNTFCPSSPREIKGRRYGLHLQRWKVRSFHSDFGRDGSYPQDTPDSRGERNIHTEDNKQNVVKEHCLNRVHN